MEGEKGACVTETFRLEGEHNPRGNAIEIVCNHGRLRTGPLMQNLLTDDDPEILREIYTPAEAVPQCDPAENPNCVCEDSNDGATDSYGDGCEWYDAYPSDCGSTSFNDADFQSETMCCSCGNG
jgi:hypothetical protein